MYEKITRNVIAIRIFLQHQKMSKLSKKYCLLFLLLMVFSVSFFVVRLSLYHEPLGFEEGIFAHLIVHRPVGPLYNLSGRVDGQNRYGYISHPFALYELLRLGGWAAKKSLEAPVYLDDAVVTPRLRMLCSSYQLLFWVLLLVLVVVDGARAWPWSILLIFTAVLSPLALKSSTLLQVDNTSGVLLCGTAALLFALAIRSRNNKSVGYALLFIGGVLAGMGKHEWSIALGLAVLAMTVVVYVLKWKVQEMTPVYLGCIATGLVVGNVTSWIIDPINYTRGIHYMLLFSKVSQESQVGWDFGRWLTFMKIRIPFLSICFLLLFIIGYFGTVAKFKLNGLTYLTALFGAILLAGYILSDHNYQMRYFAPSLAVLTVAVIMALPAQITVWGRRLLIFVIVSVLLSTLVFLNGFTPNRNDHLEQINRGRLDSVPGALLFICDGAAWNKPDIDYVNNNTIFERTKQRVSERYNKQLINPNCVNQDR